MSSPRHLWSGDWQRDSDEAARERAGRRPFSEQQTVEAPAPPPRKHTSTVYQRALAWLHDTRRRFSARSRSAAPRLRTVLAVGLIALLAAAGAYGVTRVVNSSSSSAAAVSRPAAWLGVQMQSLPVDRVLVSAVVPGGPADRAGLGPGDIITQIDNQPVTTPGDVDAAISGLHPGDKVQIVIERGLQLYTTTARLAARPAGSP
jgi:C-terminal processing protease CtpA/Prc